MIARQKEFETRESHKQQALEEKIHGQWGQSDDEDDRKTKLNKLKIQDTFTQFLVYSICLLLLLLITRNLFPTLFELS